MTVRFSGTARAWLGWCPHDGRTAAGKIPAPPDPCIPARLPCGIMPAGNDVIADYRSTGISPVLFTGFIAAITGGVLLICALRVLWSPPVSALLLCGLILGAAAAVFFENRKARVECTADSLVIRRILPWPVVIPKETIETAEVRTNVPPVPVWLPALLLLVVIPASSAGVLYGEYLQAASGGTASLPFLVRPGIALCTGLFLLALCSHARIRSSYPSVLVITTTTRKMIALYAENPAGAAGTGGRSG